MRKGHSNHLRQDGAEMRREEAAEACSEMESLRSTIGGVAWDAAPVVPLVAVMWCTLLLQLTMG